MAKKQQKVADSISQAGSLLGIDIETLKEAKARGCPGFRGSRVHLDSVRRWLEEHPEEVAPPKPVKPTHPEPHQRGTLAALRRLEDEELASFLELETLRAGPASTGKVREAERRWLRTSEALRKAEASLDTTQRSSGDLLPREECERIAQGIAYYGRIALRAAVRPLVEEFLRAGAPEDVIRVVDFAIGQVQGQLAGAMKNGCYSGTFPPWCEKAVMEGFNNQVPETIEFWADAIRRVADPGGYRRTAQSVSEPTT